MLETEIPYSHIAPLYRQREILENIMRQKSASDYKFKVLLKLTALRFSLDREDVEDVIMNTVTKLSNKLYKDNTPLIPLTHHGEVSKDDESMVKGFLYKGVYYGALNLRESKIPLQSLRASDDSRVDDQGKTFSISLHPGLEDVLTKVRFQVLKSYAEGFSYSEIADRLDMTIHSVGVCLFETRKLARSFLLSMEYFDLLFDRGEVLDSYALARKLGVTQNRIHDFHKIWFTYKK